MKLGLSRLTNAILLALTLASCDAIERDNQERISSQIEKALQDGRAYGPFYEVMRAEFPEDFADFRDLTQRGLKDGLDDAGLLAASTTFIGGFSVRNEQYLLLAPTENLLALNIETTKLLELLAASDDKTCAEFAINGQTNKQLRGRSALQLGRISLRKIEAFAAGRDTPTQHGQLTESDVTAFAAALKEQGASEAAIDDVLGDQQHLNTADAATQCSIGTAFNQAINSMPDEVAARLIVAINDPALK